MNTFFAWTKIQVARQKLFPSLLRNFSKTLDREKFARVTGDYLFVNFASGLIQIFSPNTLKKSWLRAILMNKRNLSLLANISVNITPRIRWDFRDINKIEFTLDWLTSLEHLDYLNSTHFNTPSSFSFQLVLNFK